MAGSTDGPEVWTAAGSGVGSRGVAEVVAVSAESVEFGIVVVVVVVEVVVVAQDTTSVPVAVVLEETVP